MPRRKPEQEKACNLTDAGCDEETVRCFCALEAEACQRALIRERQIRLLRKQRRMLLEQLHGCQKKIDCLDYLLYRLREEQTEKGEKP